MHIRCSLARWQSRRWKNKITLMKRPRMNSSENFDSTIFIYNFMLLLCTYGIDDISMISELWAITTHHEESKSWRMVTVIASNTCQKNVAAYELEHKSNWCQFDETNKYSLMYNIVICERSSVHTMKQPSEVINITLATLYTHLDF